ncbi:MAG: NUDIX hydrolase [Schaedlerella sp.]|nr:NUDIX hydrolase [Schaedlerella sp.]
MNEKIKRINRELKFNGKILDFYQDTMLIDNKTTAIWDYVAHRHNGGAAIVPVLDDGKILMVRQYRNAVDKSSLEVPAGAFDDEKESGLICASRELEEETGYRSENVEYLCTLHSLVAFCNEKIEIYVAHNLISTQQHLDEEEFIDLKAYTIEDLKEMIFTGEITDAKTVSALMAYVVKYGK